MASRIQGVCVGLEGSDIRVWVWESETLAYRGEGGGKLDGAGFREEILNEGLAAYVD